jgi:hypothetical protein
VDFPFDFTVHDQVVGELDGALDFDIGGEHVAGCGSRAGWGNGGRLRCAVGWSRDGSSHLGMADIWSGYNGPLGFVRILADYFFEHSFK